MKQAKRNPQQEPAACPPNLERRRFLRNLLAAGALAPVACSKSQPETGKPVTLVQGRHLDIGDISIVLTSCGEGEGCPSASIDIYKQGVPGAAYSVSMLVPCPLDFQANGFEYELQVESISCGKPGHASATLIKKGPSAGDNPSQNGGGTDIFTIGAALGLIGALLFAVFERKGRPREDRVFLSPKRNP